MKLYLVLLFILQITVWNNCIAQDYPVDYLCQQYQMSDEQKALLVAKLKGFENQANQIIIRNQMNVYFYSIMNDDQRARFDSIWTTTIQSQYKNNYNYLQLTDEQVTLLSDMTRRSAQGDSVKLTNFYSHLPKDSILPLLDSVQLSLEAQHYQEFLANRKSFIAQSDQSKAEEVAREAQRLDLTKTYYSKYLQKANRKVLEQIRKSNPAALIKIDSLTRVYQNRVQLDRANEISMCYSEDSILLSPNTKQLNEYKYDRYQIRPNLCVYWCRFGSANTAQTELEQNAIVHGLEYLKINYSDILNKATLQLKKHRTKFKEELEATWPKKNGAVVTIEPDPPIKNVEEVSEILLVLPNLN